MPGPALHRRLYVVARQGELGDIPKRIACAASACIRGSLYEHFKNYPWIVSGCDIPSSGNRAPSKGGNGS